MYWAFIDYKMVFDSIKRNLSLAILLKNRVKGKLMRAVKAMYDNRVLVLFSIFSPLFLANFLNFHKNLTP